MFPPEIVYPELFTTQRLGLCDEDYSIWKLKFHFILTNKGLDYVLHQPQPPDEPSTRHLHQKWLQDDAACRYLIYRCVQDAALDHNEPTAKSLLDSIEAFSNSTIFQRRINLFRLYVRRRMSDGDSISNHVLEMRAAAYKLELAGVKLPDEMQAAMLMNSLPESWNDVAGQLNLLLGTGPGKESELGFDNVSGRLRVAGEMMPPRSRGGDYHAGFKKYCFHCRQMGHKSSNCPQVNGQQKDNSQDSGKGFNLPEELSIYATSYYRIKTTNRLNYTGTFFSVWKSRMSMVLRSLKLIYVLTSPKPAEPMDSTPEQDANIYKKWLADDFTTRHLIFGAMEDDLLLNFHNQPTAKALMDAIDAWFEIPSLGRRMALCKQYVECIMSEDTNIRDHIYNNMGGMVHELNRAGIEVPDEVQAVVLVTSLPRSWGEETRIPMTMNIDKDINDGKKLLNSVISRVRNSDAIRESIYSKKGHTRSY